MSYFTVFYYYLTPKNYKSFAPTKYETLPLNNQLVYNFKSYYHVYIESVW